MIPTIEQVMKCYRIIAQCERMKTGRPSEDTVENAIRGTTSVCEAAGVELSASITKLTRQSFDAALSTFVDRGLTRLTAWTYICQVRAIFARWCQPYYKDAGWKLRPLELPSFRAKAPRYVRPGGEMLARVKAWYEKLSAECGVLNAESAPGAQHSALSTRSRWFAATMMLEFAMRNGDVLRLTKDNFVEKENQHYLSYTPHKTALSSGRRVYWPIHASIWQKYEDYGGLDGLDVTDSTFDEINSDMRTMGFHGQKGAYELRKICIDHVYQKYGAEMAVSISGDDIKTISRYYADPAQPNIGAVRIVDLL